MGVMLSNNVKSASFYGSTHALSANDTKGLTHRYSHRHRSLACSPFYSVYCHTERMCYNTHNTEIQLITTTCSSLGIYEL